MIVAYITKSYFGNFVPQLASIFINEHGVELLMPEASAITCIELVDAQRTLCEAAPVGAMVFSMPIDPSTTVGFVELSVLYSANAGE